MTLPKEVLLNILLHLRRCDLDWIMLVNRLMCGVVLANNKVLARRVVEKATVHGPIGDGQMSRLRLLFTDPKKLLTKKNAAFVALFSPTISVEVLELGAIHMHKLSSKQFSDAVLSFQSLSTLTTKANYSPGGHFTDDFLRRAGQMGVRFTHILDARVTEFFFNCTSVTDEGVLDYLFNPAYPIRDRSLRIYRCRLSKKFLYKLFEKMQAVSPADVDDIYFWSHTRLGSQKLGTYKAQQEHVTVKGNRITCIRFRNDAFCATVSFQGPKGWMRSCRLTTVKEKYDKVFRFV